MVKQKDLTQKIGEQERIEKTEHEPQNSVHEEGEYRDEIAPVFGGGVLLAAQFRLYCGGKHKVAPVTSGNRVKTTRSSVLSALIRAVRFGGMAILGVLMAACVFLAVCLFGGFTLHGLVPTMPYWCGAVFGLAFAALAVLAGAAILYPISFAGGRYRAVAKNAFAMFCASFLGGMLASMLSSGAGGFWHAWGWFGYMV